MGKVESGLSRRSFIGAAAGALLVPSALLEGQQPLKSPLFVELPLKTPSDAIIKAGPFGLLSQPIPRTSPDQLTKYLQESSTPGVKDVSSQWEPVYDGMNVHVYDRLVVPVGNNRNHVEISYDGTAPIHGSFINVGDEKFVAFSRPGTFISKSDHKPTSTSDRLLVKTSR